MSASNDAMNRIDAKFEELNKAGRKGLVGYLTAGDPDIETSERNIRCALDNGLDVLELGVPFSDPTADGPTIQEASYRALAAGMNVEKALELVVRLRRDYRTPIVLFGYANPFFRYGYEKICSDAAEAGADGMLVVDLSYEEREDMASCMDRKDLCLIPLIAPTTPEERVAMIAGKARGFIYYVMVTGVTGARAKVAAGIAERVDCVKKHTDLPVAVGFGVSSGNQARQVGENADAVVVGSALIKAAQNGTLAELVKELNQALA
jgi:tryptophan synthase alpha chain